VKYLLLIILLPAASIYSQSNKSISDTTKTIPIKDSLKQINVNKANDTLRRKSILELKTILTIEFYNLDKMKFVFRGELESNNFTKEELASGLTKNQLIAYKKNKEQLFSILQKKYDDAWYYRVKSLGELIGIPDWIIKTAMIGLLLLGF
jgi:hypothetical protein